MRSAQDLLDELNASDESPRIEAKRARELGKSVLETLIAFANEPGLGGGCLLLGVEWSINAKGDTVYRPEGVPDPDKLQQDLATQCVSMLSFPLRPEIAVERIDGKTLVVVQVAEVDHGHKPVYLKATGLPRGAFRRIGSTDQRCTDEDLWVLRGGTRPRTGPDQGILTDARRDDFDPAALAEYRRARAWLNPSAEELSYSDDDLLEALGAVRRVEGQPQPTLAGILLFGKSMALRRLLPMVKIDYIRVAGVEWMEDPHQRFQSIEIRKPLLLALPLAEASIIDELPKGFHLPEGELHSIQEPIVPRQVIREALANAVMHRSYSLHSPIQIIRYSNRIEVRNVGHSLKPVAELGIPGSRLRNPTLAAVLHDLNLAEAKGTGIRTMRRLAAEEGLTLPEFHSSRESDEFRVTLFLHNLLTEDDHAWLRTLTTEALDADEVKVLIYVRATGAVDNTACRDFSGLDTLTASRVLRRLRDRGLLEKQGAGSRTHYVLAGDPSSRHGGEGRLPLESPVVVDAAGGDWANSPPRDRKGCKPSDIAFNLELATLPSELATFLATLKGRASAEALREGILRLCAWTPLTVEQLATFLEKDRHYLRNKHLIPMVRDGLLRFRYPESAKHPHQAYVTAGTQGKEMDHG